MSHNSLIDDVFSKEFKHARKPSVQQILGIKASNQKGHSRFYSKEFVPFSVERDVRGRLIKEFPEQSYLEKHSTLWQLSQDINGKETSSSQQSSKAKKSLIDTRFKLHEVDHFRETPIKSHLKSGTDFAKEFQSIQNRDYTRKYKHVKQEEELWLTNGFKSVTLPVYRQNEAHNQESIFRTTVKGKSVSKQVRSKLMKSQSMEKLKLKPASYFEGQRNSHKSLFNKKQGRNPELQEIERNVRVHFNHPELERLKQSKKLQFKIVENLQSGDKKFKDKIEEYRKIKERIKKEMGKF